MDHTTCCLSRLGQYQRDNLQPLDSVKSWRGVPLHYPYDDFTNKTPANRRCTYLLWALVISWHREQDHRYATTSDHERSPVSPQSPPSTKAHHAKHAKQSQNIINGGQRRIQKCKNQPSRISDTSWCSNNSGTLHQATEHIALKTEFASELSSQ